MHIRSSFGILSKILLIFTLLLSSATKAAAQIELSNSIEFSCPFLNNANNSKLIYGQFTAGIRLGISYKPTRTQFFPTLNYSVGRTKLPLQQFNNTNVATIDFNYSNLMLYGNFVFSLYDGNSVYLLGGIGFSRLVHKNLMLSGPGAGSMSIQLDSTKYIDKLFPAVGVGVEYVYGDAVDKNLYISIGFMLLYTYLYPERNYYSATVNDNNTLIPISANLNGHPITPSINLTLHVLVGKYMIFWKK